MRGPTGRPSPRSILVLTQCPSSSLPRAQYEAWEWRPSDVGREVSLVNALREGAYASCGVAPLLLDEWVSGAEPGRTDGVQALHLAVAEGSAIAVAFLLKNGAGVNAVRTRARRWAGPLGAVG